MDVLWMCYEGLAEGGGGVARVGASPEPRNSTLHSWVWLLAGPGTRTRTRTRARARTLTLPRVWVRARTRTRARGRRESFRLPVDAHLAQLRVDCHIAFVYLFGRRGLCHKNQVHMHSPSVKTELESID